MTPVQQMMMAGEGLGEDPISDTLEFRTRAEYDEWMRSRKNA